MVSSVGEADVADDGVDYYSDDDDCEGDADMRMMILRMMKRLISLVEQNLRLPHV